MFDIGWSELAVVGVVALLVVGPKELPGMLRTLGRTLATLRRMAGDFQSQFNEALREAELDGLKREVQDLRRAAEVSVDVPKTIPTASSTTPAPTTPAPGGATDAAASPAGALAPGEVPEVPGPAAAAEASPAAEPLPAASIPVEQPSPVPTPEPIPTLGEPPPLTPTPAATGGDRNA